MDITSVTALKALDGMCNVISEIKRVIISAFMARCDKTSIDTSTYYVVSNMNVGTGMSFQVRANCKSSSRINKLVSSFNCSSINDTSEDVSINSDVRGIRNYDSEGSESEHGVVLDQDVP